MSRPPRILAFAGSTRHDSHNVRLLRAAVAMARRRGAEVTLLDLADYPLPIFNQDDEAEDGLPESARRLKELFVEHQGLLIASPEYNSSLTPLLKNVIDWVSRRDGAAEPPLVAYRGKVAALLSASPGALGGLRGLVHLRAILANIGVLVLPKQKALARAHDAFSEEGELRHEADRDAVEAVVGALTELLERLRPAEEPEQR